MLVAGPAEQKRAAQPQWPVTGKNRAIEQGASNEAGGQQAEGAQFK